MSDLPPVLQSALAQHGKQAKDRFLEHLQGGTSCNYLSDWLKRAGTPVSPTTLKEARRALA